MDQEGKVSKRYIKKSLSSYESRLINNNLEIHLVIYSDSHLYDYNPYTKEFRPFNSVMWYKMDDDKYYDIINYLSDIYDKILQSFYSEKDNYSVNNFGLLSGNTVAIEIDSIKDDFIDKTGKHGKKEFDDFSYMIQDIYTEWNKMLSFVLDNYDQKSLEKMFKF